ncbi:M20/M25/M40 family metallo-hydrolase [Pyxidicoccus sp. 3LFB2]
MPLPMTREVLEALLAFDTSPEGKDHLACVSWLREQLEALGFVCRLHRPLPGAPALLEAHRPARGLEGHVVLYGHYDVTPFRGSAGDRATLVEARGRWFAHGVSDNKGPLAARLIALRGIQQSPALTWFIQGEEETGSAVASQVFGERLRGLAAGLWLEETGYHDFEDGTLRLIACRLGADGVESLAPDEPMQELLTALRLRAERWGIQTRQEVRKLNKAAVKGGCPFHRSLPPGARYLALGINDSRSHAHGVDESVPLWTFPLHAEQLQDVFHWVDRGARRET